MGSTSHLSVGGRSHGGAAGCGGSAPGLAAAHAGGSRATGGHKPVTFFKFSFRCTSCGLLVAGCIQVLKGPTDETLAQLVSQCCQQGMHVCLGTWWDGKHVLATRRGYSVWMQWFVKVGRATQCVLRSRMAFTLCHIGNCTVHLISTKKA